MSSALAPSGAFVATLPEAFVELYRRDFRGARRIYGHWSGGLYTRVTGPYHRHVSVLAPVELDTAVERYLDARRRRVGGALPGLWETVLEYKAQARIQVTGHAPFDEDLAGHTRGRDTGSVALGLMCGLGIRPNDLGPAAPLPGQLRALARLVADACIAVGSPVEGFLTASEAADNLDFPPGDERVPHPPHGYRSTGETWDLEIMIDPRTLELHPPASAPQPDRLRLGDWVRQEALSIICHLTRDRWLPGA